MLTFYGPGLTYLSYKTVFEKCFIFKLQAELKHGQPLFPRAGASPSMEVVWSAGGLGSWRCLRATCVSALKSGDALGVGAGVVLEILLCIEQGRGHLPVAWPGSGTFSIARTSPSLGCPHPSALVPTSLAPPLLSPPAPSCLSHSPPASPSPGSHRVTLPVSIRALWGGKTSSRAGLSTGEEEEGAGKTRGN